MQTGRLFEITYILLERGTVSARELAERFEVTARTIYRDVERLSAAGVPVYMERGRNGGLRLLGDFVLDKTILTQAEKDEVLSSLAGLSAVGGGASDALKKLAALFGGPGADWIEVDFSGWGWSRDIKDLFELIKEAVLSRRALSFEYHGLRGEGSVRVVEPLKMVFRGQAWYVYAWCRARKADRFFKLSRMRNVEMTHERFTRSAPARVIAYNDGPKSGETVFVRFTADKSVAFLVYDAYPPDAVRIQPDGSLLVGARIARGDWLLSYFLTFGAHVELLEPQWLRDDLRKALEAMTALYGEK